MDEDGMSPPRSVEERTLCARVIQALREQRVLTSNRLVAYAGASKERVLAAVDDLVQRAQVRVFQVRDRAILLLPNRAFEACDCDGTCGEQACLLCHHPVRHLWIWMHQNSPCDSSRLLEFGRSQGWSRSVLYHHLDRLIQVDLVRRIPSPPHGDKRLGWYEAKDPLPSAQAILGMEICPTIGQNDKALSTEEDS